MRKHVKKKVLFGTVGSVDVYIIVGVSYTTIPYNLWGAKDSQASQNMHFWQLLFNHHMTCTHPCILIDPIVSVTWWSLYTYSRELCLFPRECSVDDFVQSCDPPALLRLAVCHQQGDPLWQAHQYGILSHTHFLWSWKSQFFAVTQVNVVAWYLQRGGK